MVPNANSIVQLAIQITYGITKLVNVNIKIIVHAKKIIVAILPSTCICENSKYLNSIADTSVIECDEIINTIATNVASTASINCYKEEIAIFCTQFY